MTTPMPKFPAILFLMLAFTVWAGDDTTPASAPRREFRQRKTYPYIFEPVPYLENGAPAPMRFEAAGPDVTRHSSPPIPRPTPVVTPTPSPNPPPTPVPPSPLPSKVEATPAPVQAAPSSSPETFSDAAYPPPGNAQPVAQQQDALDLTKYPSEIVEVFKNPYNIPSTRKKFLDPVFEPAQPPAQKQASKANYRQK